MPVLRRGSGGGAGARTYGGKGVRAIYVDKDIPRMLAVKALRPIWSNVIWAPISPARVVQLPEPQLPGGRWVRVRNQQCGICATDLALLQIKADPGVAPAALPGNQRFYLGHEVVGVIDELGPQVTRMKAGDRVVMESRFGGPNCLTQEIEPRCARCANGETRLCEKASLGIGPRGIGGGWGDGYTAHEEEIWVVPRALTGDQACMIEPTAVALHAVLRCRPRQGDHVLVVGSGVIGLLVTQAVKAVSPECHLAVTARYPHQADMARRFGADAVFSGKDVYGQAAELTGGTYYQAPMNRGMLLGGFDVVYDCVGSGPTMNDALRLARAGGTVVLVGINLSPSRLDINPVWYQEVNLIGSHTFGPEEWEGRRVHTYDLVIEWLQQGKLTIDGLITHRFPFEAHRQAIRTALDKRTGSIKVLLVYD
jgi:threonine dehydrogenase-like Zn-dependent dehydrogenase